MTDVWGSKRDTLGLVLQVSGNSILMKQKSFSS